MTNPETKAQYEGAILSQLVKNAEKLSVIEFKFSQIEPKIDNLDHRLGKVEPKIDNLDHRLSEIEPKINNLDHRLSEIEKLLGWLKIIGGGVVAIALSLIANFIYSYLI